MGFHGFADLTMGGKVHDTLNVFSLKEVTYSADVVDVFPYESYRRWYSPDMAPGQIVQDDDVMSLSSSARTV